MTDSPTPMTFQYTPAATDDAPTLVLVHGFLDDSTVWDPLITALSGRTGTARYDLPGFGARVDDTEAVTSATLSSLADEVHALLAGIATPVIVVGQSMGAQIADIVAANHTDQVAALVLLTPVPLSGTRLPDSVIAPLRGLGGHPEAQRTIRAALSPGLSVEQLDRLVAVGAPVTTTTTAHYAGLFNAGVGVTEFSPYPGPVTIIYGANDGFVTDDMMAAVATRYPTARTEILDGAGHWLHVEASQPLAAILTDIADQVSGDGGTAWRHGFATTSASAFGAGFAEDIVLEASTLRLPVHGRTQVAAVMAAASLIYETLEFTAESRSGATTYLQWRATAFGGKAIDGVTVLERDPDNQLARAAIHHRPLEIVLQFSAALGQRLAGVVSGEHFLATHD
ncbi:alpha/beta hydrolase [Mycolicibacterium sp. 018/SC-01/001]|uniref:alpha/beta fold hydrolase n=1 Tax=Mycolicibacterium sp. 018/SC-01/001 TaxID=2592069 RepID=UPI00117E25C3|nr:alpha/beta hydrolase [Mycolicibacterium sp. 018/SC-01/001]TRW89157.1 alpha/beta hydrolase [Mycolicibacterium sp. 018/SC-01/001]